MPRKKPKPTSDSLAPTHRMLRLHQHLKEERSINAVVFAKECGVEPHTIRRDIEKMRSEFGAPIAWDAVAGTYSCDGSYDDLKHVSIAPAEAGGLCPRGPVGDGVAGHAARSRV